MYKLVCISGMNKGQEYELPDGQELTLGRSEKNSICVFDKKSSRHHCRMLARGDDILLEDLNSTNGLRVNEEYIKGTVRLKSGDQVGIGQTIFLLADSSVPASMIVTQFEASPTLDPANQKKYENLLQKTTFQATKTTALRRIRTEEKGRETGFLSFFTTKEENDNEK